MKILRPFYWISVFCIFLSASGPLAWSLDEPDQKSKSLASYMMGVIYDLQGTTQKAIEEFEKAAAFEENYNVHLRIGADFARLGKLDEAVSELQRVLELDQNNVQARYLLALIYSTRKEFDKAALQYESILTSFSEADPENLEIYGYLGQLYYSQKKYDEAIKQFEILLSLDQDNTDILFLVGSLYLEKDNREKAVEYFSRAILYDPMDDVALNSLAYIYAEDGVKLDEAQKLIERALAIDPENGAYLDSMGWVYFKQGQYEKALMYLHKADRYLKDPVIYEHIGDVYFTLKNAIEAEKYWKLSIESSSLDKGRLEEKLKALESLQ